MYCLRDFIGRNLVPYTWYTSWFEMRKRREEGWRKERRLDIRTIIDPMGKVRAPRNLGTTRKIQDNIKTRLCFLWCRKGETSALTRISLPELFERGLSPRRVPAEENRGFLNEEMITDQKEPKRLEGRSCKGGKKRSVSPSDALYPVQPA